MSIMDEDCCSRCFGEAPLYSLHALISSYPIFDQIIGPDFEEEARKNYCEECYLLKFDKLLYPLMEKGQLFPLVKAIRTETLLIIQIKKNQIIACPLCGTEWGEEEAPLENNKETKKFFEYICKKNDFRDPSILIRICMKCAGKIEVERLKEIKPEKYPLLISKPLFTAAGKLYFEKCLKEG